jgi:hypothetical protein
MRSDYRRGSLGRSRDRWRPPDQKRGRGPAGDRTADLKNTTGDGNILTNTMPQLALQASGGLDPAVVRALGGDRIPPIPPPRLVGGRQ